MANIGLPGSCNFIGEFIVFAGLVDRNFIILFFSVTCVVLSVLYTMFFCNRIIFGNLNINYIVVYKDMTFRELSIILPLFILTIILGVLNVLHTEFFWSMLLGAKEMQSFSESAYTDFFKLFHSSMQLH